MRNARRRVLAATVSWTMALAGAHAADLATVIAAAKVSVLPVGTFNPTDSPRFGFRGTGFAVGDGTIVVTNFHVLPAGAEVDSGPVMMVLSARSGEPQRRGRVLATDRVHDLALLRIEGSPLPALTLDAPGAVREGQSVALMGFPIGGTLGFAPVTHRGIVASITTAALPAATAQSLDPRAVSRLREGNFELLQLDATAYPGNSGGPLMDAESGRVVGIISMVLIKGARESAISNPSGITYAVPVRYLHDLLKAARP